MARKATTKPRSKGGAAKTNAKQTATPKTDQTKAPTAPQTSEKQASAPANQPTETAATVFDQAVGFVLKERIEGGYVNDPRDPGGETNFGISKRAYPKVKIADLTEEDAIEIYKRDYWDAAGCDDLPPKVAVAVFDAAVNQGVGIAKRLLQRAARVTADGIIGPKSLKAIQGVDEDELVVQYLGWRLRRYAFTANASTYMRGWANRVLYLQAFLTTEFKVAK
jgi:lysozyme family protein